MTSRRIAAAGFTVLIFGSAWACSARKDAALGTMPGAPASTELTPAPTPTPTVPVAPPAKGPVFYVSPNGSDANDGLAPGSAKKSIRAAVDIANTGGVDEIRVCRGVFVEDALRLTAPTSLRGGYDCTTWTRASDFGALTDAQASTLTTLRRGPVPGRTLDISGETIGEQVIVDGFVIDGPDGEVSPLNPKDVVAVVIDAGAGPTFRDNIVNGGKPLINGQNLSSVGLLLGKDTHATVSRISASGGRSARFSVGVQVEGAGATELTESKIDGGQGNGFTIGLSVTRVISGALQATPPRIALRRNTIGGGDAVPLASTAGRIGVRVVGSGVLIEENTITAAGTSPCMDSQPNPISGCLITGIDVGAGAAEIRGNHISADSPPLASGAQSPARAGVALNDATGTLVANNVIHVGRAGSDANSVVGVHVDTSPEVRIVHNTVLGGRYGLQISSRWGGADQTLGVSKIAIVDNLFVGDRTDSRALVTYACPSAEGVTIRGNVFADLGPNAPIATMACDNTARNEGGLGQLGAAFGTGDFTGNRELAPVCNAGRDACQTCGGPTPADGCGAALFEKFDPLTVGLDGWLAHKLKVRSDAKCAWTDAGSIVPDALTDAFGNTRTAPVTAGAHEAPACAP